MHGSQVGVISTLFFAFLAISVLLAIFISVLNM